MMWPERADPTASVPNLDGKVANEVSSPRYRLVVVTTLQNGGWGKDLTVLIKLVESVVGHDAVRPCPKREQSIDGHDRASLT
jgi:hypothetical protein